MATGWLSWGSDPFAELVEKATSELLPPNHEDVALNLEICDQIRAKQVQPKHAMQTIKKRLGHANPNVVLLTLGLTDICIKNSGDHFLAEVGSAEFMDNLVSILNAGTGPGKNVDVRNKMLRLIQSWAQVADARPAQMSYVERVYSDLKKRGFPFPPSDPSHVVSAALVETLTAPEWADSDVCLRCRQSFTTFTRKHHCRNCGNVFCATCSSNTMSLPWFGIGQDVRVCDGCHTNRGPPSNARRAKPAPPPAPKTNDGLSRSATVGGTAIKSSGRGGVGNAYVAPARSNTVTASSSSSRRKKEEDELALAIKLSLESSTSSSSNRVGPGYVPSAPGSAANSAASALRGPSGRLKEGTDAVSEDDPDLAAAIAASLRDYSVPQPSAPSGFSDVASIASMPPTPAPQSDASIYDGGSYMTANSVYNRPYVQQQQPQSAPPPSSEPQLPIPPSIELPSQDVDSLLSFSQTVLRAEEAAGRAAGHPYAAQQLHQTTSDSQTQGLYDRAQLARPKMARSLDEAGRRHSVLVGMHEKLTEAVKLYNRLLDAQMGRGPQIVYGPGSGQAPAPPQNGRETEPHPGYGQAVSSPAHNSFYPQLPQGPPPAPVSVSSPSAQFQQAQPLGFASPYGTHSQHTGYGPPSGYAPHISNPVPEHVSTPGAGSSQGGAPWPVAPSGPPTAPSQVAAVPVSDPSGSVASPYQQYAYPQHQQHLQGYGYGQVPGAPGTAAQMYGNYGAAQVQSPLQVEAQLPPSGGAPQAGAPTSAPQQPEGLAGGSSLASAPSELPQSPAGTAPPAAAQSQPQSSWTPTQTSFASAYSPAPVAAPAAAATTPSQPSFSDLNGHDSPSKLANAPSAPQFAPSAPTQEPWRREDERPLIDL